MRNINSKILDKSLKIAHQLLPTRNDKFIHFAFMFDRNKLLSIGQNNTFKTNAKMVKFGQRFNVPEFVEWPMIHAEIDSISKLWGNTYIDSSLTLLVLRMNKRGKLLNSKPCSRCQVILNALGLDKVHWSTEEGFKSDL